MYDQILTNNTLKHAIFDRLNMNLQPSFFDFATSIHTLLNKIFPSLADFGSKRQSPDSRPEQVRFMLQKVFFAA